MVGVTRTAVGRIAVGVGQDGRRLTLALSEAETHWREFLQRLVARCLHGVEFIVMGQHAGLGNVLRAVFPAAVR